MKTLTIVGILGLLAVPAWAQPYPEPPPTVPSTQDPYNTQEYDPNQDYDSDIDGYDAEYDVRYDQAAAQEYDDGYDPNAYTQFEGSLAPYGNWVDDSSYGRVWVPSASNVGLDFTPYASGGHWVLSEYGWTWVSDWNWGWAPFHYGRWAMCAGYGWAWIPGSVWGPAWVSWRAGGGYVGWAPLPPRGVTVGPPSGVRSPWRFVVASQLSALRPSFLPAHVVGGVFSRTGVISNGRTVAIGPASVRVNAGPTGVLAGATVPTRLSMVAPHAAPNASIQPHAGAAMSARPWVRAGVTTQVPMLPASSRSIPIGPQHPAGPTYRTPVYVPRQAPVAPRPMMPHTMSAPTYSAPVYGRPTYASPRPYAAPSPAYRAPAYSAPVYRAPAYSAPVYRAPAYSAPAYSAPAYSAPAYRAPSYSAPAYHAPSYSAPSYHSAPAPSYSRPSSSPGFSHPSGGGGGRHR